jgi:DNA repair photolyase
MTKEGNFELKVIPSDSHDGGFEDRKYPGCPTYIAADPYKGCAHDCAYCIAIHTRETPAGVVAVKEDFVTTLKAKLIELQGRGRKAPIYLSPWTDAYQPAEEKLRITRQVLEMLADMGFPFFIITKSDLVTRDLDIMTREGVQCNVCMSVISPHDKLREMLEPGTATIPRRFAALKAISDCQIRTILKVDPIIPGLTDTFDDLSAIISCAADAHVNHITAEILRLTPYLWQHMKKVLPDDVIEKIKGSYFPQGNDIPTPSSGENIYVPDDEKQRLLQMVRDIAHEKGMTFSTCGYTTGLELNEGMCLGLKLKARRHE